jgi:hypothetical protein
MRVSVALTILVISCRAAPPSAAAPESLTFRSFRLEGVRPAGYGYSVISDRHIWEQFVRDRVPSFSMPSEIDFATHSLVILHANSGTQCFEEPVVRRVIQQADTVRIFLGALMGPCQMTDEWIEVIELPRFRGPVRLDYPLDEFRPSWIEREIRLPLDPEVAGFAAAPDSVPAWLRSDSSIARPSQYIAGPFVRNIVAIRFRSEATPAERRSAIALVGGRLVGGHRAIGVYLVRVADPGDGSGIERAAERLRSLPYVVLATPDYVRHSD